MYLGYRFFKYLVVIVFGMFLVTATVVADGTKEPVVVGQIVKTEGNKEETIPPVSDQQKKKLSENDKIILERLKEIFDVTLVGAIISNTGKPVVIIEDNRSKIQKFYRQGDMIRGGRITEIYKDRVVLIKDGVELDLKLNSGASRRSGAPIIEKRYSDMDNTVDAKPGSTEPAKVEEYDSGFLPNIKREDLESIISAKEFSLPVTMLDDGGFRIDDVQPGGIFNKMGLGVGDVILSFNSQMPDTGSSFSDAIAQALPEGSGVNTLRIVVEDQDGNSDVLYLGIDDSSVEQGTSE
jgi:type II secretory pathway component PulC